MDDPNDGQDIIMMDPDNMGDGDAPLMSMAKSSSEQDSSALYRPYKEGFIIMLTIVGSIGGFLFGYDTGIIAGA